MNGDDVKALGAVGDALHNLLDAAEEQQKLVEQQQKIAATAIQGVNAATISLKDTAASLKRQVATEIQEALDDASTKAAKLLAKKFIEADTQANLAAERYRSAVKWAAWQVFGITFVLGMAVSAGSACVLIRSIPSYDEIEALQAEKAQLQNTINVLERKGGRATVVPCTNQRNRPVMCVKAVDAGTGKRYWAIIDGN